jgi:hypothetical protein
MAKRVEAADSCHAAWFKVISSLLLLLLLSPAAATGADILFIDALASVEEMKAFTNLTGTAAKLPKVRQAILDVSNKSCSSMPVDRLLTQC